MTRFPKARPTAGQKRVRPLKTVSTHVFIDAGQTNHAGEGICNTCGHLRTNRIHDLYVPAHTVEVDARTMGEAENR